MIIVLGSVVVKDGHVDEALEISQKHVERSRTESGCIVHGVHRDFENPQRLVFVEKWTDMAALTQHFKESTSLAFVKKLKEIILHSPEMTIYDANQVN